MMLCSTMYDPTFAQGRVGEEEVAWTTSFFYGLKDYNKRHFLNEN